MNREDIYVVNYFEHIVYHGGWYIWQQEGNNRPASNKSSNKHFLSDVLDMTTSVALSKGECPRPGHLPSIIYVMCLKYGFWLGKIQLSFSFVFVQLGQLEEVCYLYRFGNRWENLIYLFILPTLLYLIYFFCPHCNINNTFAFVSERLVLRLISLDVWGSDISIVQFN